MIADNVLVVASGGDITLKIADFGLARITSTSGRLAAGCVLKQSHYL